MGDTLDRLRAARFDGPQALYTEAVRLLSERPALPDNLAGLVARARYMVGNPSAWEGYDEGASEMIRSLADAIEALAAREPQCAVMKPLDWSGNWKDCWRSTGLERVYDILELSTGRFILTFASKLVECDTLEAAKAAAQADCEARVLSAITLRTEADVHAEAWAAALEAAAEACATKAMQIPMRPSDRKFGGLYAAGDAVGSGAHEGMGYADLIRAMITDDARSALDRIKAEAKEAWMREAAGIARSVFDGMPSICRENHEYFDGFDDATRKAEAAILAAITKARK